MDFDLKVQLNLDLERAVLLLGLAVLVDVSACGGQSCLLSRDRFACFIRTSLHDLADLLGAQFLKLLVGHLDHVLHRIFAAQGRGGRVLEKSTAGVVSKPLADNSVIPVTRTVPF